MISLATNRTGFVTILCDGWGGFDCNSVRDYPRAWEAFRVSAPLFNVPERFRGFRLVRELVGTDATDYLIKFDTEKFELSVAGIYMSSPASPLNESVDILTRSYRAIYVYDYRM